MDIAVDPDELRSLAHWVTGAAVALRDMGGGGGRSAALSVVGTPALASGLAEVESNWSRARARIQTELDEAARALAAAAAAYDEVESASLPGVP